MDAGTTGTRDDAVGLRHFGRRDRDTGKPGEIRLTVSEFDDAHPGRAWAPRPAPACPSPTGSPPW